MLSAEHYEASPAILFLYPEDAGEFEWYSWELEKLDSKINTEEVVEECSDDLAELEYQEEKLFRMTEEQAATMRGSRRIHGLQ